MSAGSEGSAAGRGLAGFRPTRQRVAVLQAVERLGVFSSAQAIHEALDHTGDHVGLSTVYRSLQLLAENGQLDSVRSHDGEMLYRRCAASPHHHLVCRQCGTAVEIPRGAAERVVQDWARAAGYRHVEHVLQIFGTCPQCAEVPRG